MDSRWNVTEDPLYGSGSWDTSFGGFGGIVGRPKIVFRRQGWIEDSVQVRSGVDANGSWYGTSLSGSISTVLTALSWICVCIHSRRALPCPVCA